MSKQWGGTKIGSWAADAEAELAELQSATVSAAAVAANSKTFPSFKESISSKPNNKKITLSELYGSSSRPEYGPTTARNDTQRYPDEYASASRGFSNYDDGGRRGGFDDVASSRSDNWGSMKRNVSNGRVCRYSSLGGWSGSRADDVDNWSFDKKPAVAVVVVGEPTRSSHFGSGFVERSKLVLEPRSSIDGGNVGVVGPTRPSHFGSGFVERTKLVLEPRSSNDGGNVGVVGPTRPSSSQSSREESGGGSSSQSSRGESGVGGGVVGKERMKVNPFGDAKPREVLLEEKGLDWRQIDLQLEQRRVHRFVEFDSFIMY